MAISDYVGWFEVVAFVGAAWIYFCGGPSRDD